MFSEAETMNTWCILLLPINKDWRKQHVGFWHYLESTIDWKELRIAPEASHWVEKDAFSHPIIALSRGVLNCSDSSINFLKKHTKSRLHQSTSITFLRRTGCEYCLDIYQTLLQKSSWVGRTQLEAKYIIIINFLFLNGNTVTPGQ